MRYLYFVKLDQVVQFETFFSHTQDTPDCIEVSEMVALTLENSGVDLVCLN